LENIEGVYGSPHPLAGYARIYFPTSSWLHRRELAEQVGFWRQPDELSWAIDYDFYPPCRRGGKRFAFLPSLGVLKFHSQVWKFYAREGEPPQERWLQEILKTPAQLNERVLAEIATLCSSTSGSGQETARLAWDETRRPQRRGQGARSRVDKPVWPSPLPVGPLLRRRMQRSAPPAVIRGLTSTH